jgi:hypothetical protein
MSLTTPFPAFFDVTSPNKIQLNSFMVGLSPENDENSLPQRSR